MKLDKSLKDRMIRILQRLVQIPTENPPVKTEEEVNLLITDVFKEE